MLRSGRNAILALGLLVASVPAPGGSSDPEAGVAWDWAACRPEVLRRARPVDLGLDPFARSEKEAVGVAQTPLPEPVRKRLLEIEGQLRAALADPRPLALVGNRLLQPGDELEPVSDGIGGETRIFVQTVDHEVLSLALVIRPIHEESRQVEVSIRKRSSASGGRR
jgi:hypothetical protein